MTANPSNLPERSPATRHRTGRFTPRVVAIYEGLAL